LIMKKITLTLAVLTIHLALFLAWLWRRKRAAELKDEALFSQGHESYQGECPICLLPFRVDLAQSRVNPCCVKWICDGCILAAHERGLGNVCAFCREPIPRDDAASAALIQKRVDAGDAKAMQLLGERYFFGLHGIQKDEVRGIELLKGAANRGSPEAQFNVGVAYASGELLEKDETKAVYLFEIAAKAGHPYARLNLGLIESTKRNYDRALKHLVIAAKMGEEVSVTNIQSLHRNGLATKEDYFQALVGYQQAAEETKSDQREKAKAYFQARRGSA